VARARRTRIHFEQQSAIGVGDGNRVIDHGAQRGVERELRVQKRRRLQQEIQFPQAIGRGRAAGQMFDTGEDSLNRFLGRGSVEDNLIGVLEPERNDVAFFQDMSLDFLAIQKDSLPVSAIFNVAVAVSGNNGSALPGNQRVGKLEVIPGFAATAHDKRPFGDAHRPARAVRGHHLDRGFIRGYRIRHKEIHESEIVTCAILRLK